MIRFWTVALITSLSIIVSVILNAWLLIPTSAMLCFLTKKLLNTLKTAPNAAQFITHFGLLALTAAVVTKLISGFVLILLVFSYLIGFNADTKCSTPREITTFLPCTIFLGYSEFSTNSEKIINAIIPKVNIKVRLFDGSEQRAKLTHTAANAIETSPYSEFFLDCGVNPKFDSDSYNYSLCNLQFHNLSPLLPTFPPSASAQFSWIVGANLQGMTDIQTLELSRPIVWPPNNATTAYNESTK